MPSTRIRHCVLTAFCTISILSHASSQSERAATYLTIQVPGAIATYPTSVNDSMAVTGSYSVSATITRGFVQDADGNITTFSVRNSPWTAPRSINAAGDITGFFATDTGNRGFLRHADGEIVTFAAPAAVSNESYLQVLPFAINDYDEIAGNTYFSPNGAAGFVRATTGAFKTFHDTVGMYTVLTGLNGSGTVVGYVELEPGAYPVQSFYVDAEGYQTFFDFQVDALPGYRVRQEQTIAESIAADGTIVGVYNAGLFCISSCAGKSYYQTAGEFVRSPQGVYTSFQVPGPDASGLQINGNGTVIGSYMDTTNMQHGFVRDPQGEVTSFDPPRGMRTTPTSINDAGVVAGSFYYQWNQKNPVGFLRIPKP